MLLDQYCQQTLSFMDEQSWILFFDVEDHELRQSLYVDYKRRVARIIEQLDSLNKSGKDHQILEALKANSDFTKFKTYKHTARSAAFISFCDQLNDLLDDLLLHPGKLTFQSLYHLCWNYLYLFQNIKYSLENEKYLNFFQEEINYRDVIDGYVIYMDAQRLYEEEGTQKKAKKKLKEIKLPDVRKAIDDAGNKVVDNVVVNVNEAITKSKKIRKYQHYYVLLILAATYYTYANEVEHG